MRMASRKLAGVVWALGLTLCLAAVPVDAPAETPDPGAWRGTGARTAYVRPR